jgi:hypothetical protein
MLQDDRQTTRDTGVLIPQDVIAGRSATRSTGLYITDTL